MKYLKSLIIGLFILGTSNLTFSQYSYCMSNYEIVLKNGSKIKGYLNDNCKWGDTLTLFKSGNEVFSTMRNEWRMDTVEIYTMLYSYSYTSKYPYDDTSLWKKNFYWNMKRISIKDIKFMYYQGEIIESTLNPASFNEITNKDTIWMKTPAIDSYRIGIFDSIVSNVYISGCNYTFYAHSNSMETKAFMSKVRALDKKLLEYAIKEYNKKEHLDDNQERYGFELDDKKIDLMHHQVEELIKKINKLKIVLIYDCFD